MEYLNILFLNSISSIIIILNGISFKKLLGFKGGIGKSGLEAMLVKNVLITSSPQLITEPFFENPPSISINPSELRKTIEDFIENPDKIKSISNKQYGWTKNILL